MDTHGVDAINTNVQEFKASGRKRRFTRSKGPGVEFAGTEVYATPSLEVTLWLKHCRSAQASSTELRLEKPRSSLYVVYADWSEQGRHLLPNLTGGSHAECMSRNMESP